MRHRLIWTLCPAFWLNFVAPFQLYFFHMSLGLSKHIRGRKKTIRLSTLDCKKVTAGQELLVHDLGGLVVCSIGIIRLRLYFQPMPDCRHYRIFGVRLE